MMSALFSPLRLADLNLANRIVVSPMCQYSANDGVADDWHMTHLGMLANSGAGLLVVEATHVERHGRITHGCLGLYSDACEATLARIVAHCRRIGGAKLAIQLAHAGRKASSQRPWEGGKALPEGEDPWPTIAPSALPFGPGWHMPRCVGVGGGSLPNEPGYNVSIAEQVRRETGIPTRVVGRIVGPKQAEAIVAEGRADMVALARAFLDDPHWGWHAAQVLGGEVSRPPQYHRVSPVLWPAAALRA